MNKMNNDKAYYESEEFWNKAPEDVTHFLPEHSVNKCTPFTWIKIDGNKTYFSYEENPINWILWEDVNDYPEDIKAFIKRPSFPKKEKEWFVDGKCVALPPVGTELEWKELTGFKWVKAKVLFISETSVVLQRFDGFEWQMPTKRVVFRPHAPKERTMQEKILDKWVAQGIDFAYDTPSSQYTLGSVFDFVVKTFKVEDKEEK